MKKVLTIIAVIAISGNLMVAQDEGNNDLKNFRFGLKVTPSVNWYQPDGKLISANGIRARYGGGLITEFRLSKVVCIETGAQIDVDGGKVKYNNGGPSDAGSNTVSYYYNNLDDKIAVYDPVLAYSPSYTHYQLNERTYKITYITVPVALKMKTKEIGDFIYYGQIGVNNSFRWKGFADDELQVINDATNVLGSKESKTKVDITNDMSIYTASLNFGLGAEMNLSGTTSLTFGLNYNSGFTNVVSSNSSYLERRVNDATYSSSSNSGAYTLTKMPQAIKTRGLILTVGILF